MGAAVVEEVEFDISAAFDELVFALLCCPVFMHRAADEVAIDVLEGFSNILGEGEIIVPAFAVEIVIKYAAYTAWFVAVGEEKIFIAPFFEFWVVALIMFIAAGF